MLSHITTLLWNTRRTGVLLILQILLAFIVLFAIFSYATSAFTDYSERLGFRVEDTYLIVPPVFRLDSAAIPSLMERARQEVEQLPEIKSASLVGFVTPFGNMNMGYGNDESGTFIFTRIFMADEYLAEVMEVTMARGRWYTPEDTIGGRNVIVINEAFVESNFPGGNLVDTTFLMFGKETTVVGVARNFKYRREFESEEALIMRFDNPYDDSGNYPYSSLLAHTQPNPTAALEEDVFQRVTEVIATKGTTVTALEPIRERTSRSSLVLLIALLSICAFLVANVALGLFGILINAIAKRRGEIGLRKAMGATGLNITAQFTLEVVLIALLGITLGSLVAVQIPLFELIELETRYFWWGGVLAAALILVIVLLCALIPSSQAARVHAAVALREE